MVSAIGYDQDGKVVFEIVNCHEFGQRDANELYGVASQVVVNGTPLTPQNPSQAVDMANLFASAVEDAKFAIVRLKADAWSALVASGMQPAEATAAGVGLALYPPVKNAIQDFELAGGHPMASSALLAAITEPTTLSAFPWLQGPVLHVFQDALGS